MHQPALLLFDVDGTLIDTAGAGRRAMEAAFREVFEVDAIVRHASTVRFAGMTDWRIIEAIAAAVGVEAAWNGRRMDRLREAYVRHLAKEMLQPDPRRRILPGVSELLERLAGLPAAWLGLLTGNLERGARTKLEPFGLNRFFPDGAFGSEHPDRRELARIAHERACRRSGIAFPADRVFVVGDTEHDVDCAQAQGFRAIAVRTGWGSAEALGAMHPDFWFEDLSDHETFLRSTELLPP